MPGITMSVISRSIAAGMPFCEFERGFAAGRFDHGVACGLQKFAGDFAHVLFVFGEQNGFGAARELRLAREFVPTGFERLVDARKINLERGAFAEFAVAPR